MAASTRAITPTHANSFTAPNRPSTPGANVNVLSRNSNPSATFGVHLTKSPRGLSPRLSPQPLTGAAAMAEERHPVIQSLLGASQSNVSSRPKDQSPQPTQMSAPMVNMAKSLVIPEQVTTDTMQTSPVSLSSFGSADSITAPTATAHEATAGGPVFSIAKDTASHHSHNQQQHHHHHHHHQPIAPSPNDPGNRAFTFPGPMPPQDDPRAPARQMSLPGYNGPKSPSTKRHKCPYCSTDFTRHHNLKSHLLTHSQEKPYECPTCQARFRRLHDLKRHTKLHTGERPHTCPKCGRRFARGDALARHNKGQGGCAGRRSSFSVDDDMADGKGDDMDGVVYHGEHDGEGDDDDDSSGRRVSEPARKRQNTGNSSTQGPYHQHSSTYPPIIANRAPMGHNDLRPLYPPLSRDQTTHISPKIAPSSISSLHYNGNQSNVFGHGGMTESPKPLSPGQIDHRLNSLDSSFPGPRSPSMSQQVHQHNIARGTGRGSSPMQLAPPHGSTGPHLPSLPGLNPLINKRESQGGIKNGPSMLHQQLTGPGSTSQPGSISSHGASSVGSMREAMGNQPDVWQYVRDMEARMARMEKEHEANMSTLQGEVTTLRAQLAQQHQQGSQ